MTFILELSNKDFKAAIIKMLKQQLEILLKQKKYRISERNRNY